MTNLGLNEANLERVVIDLPGPAMEGWVNRYPLRTGRSRFAEEDRYFLQVYGTDAHGKPISERIPLGETSKKPFHTFRSIQNADSKVGMVVLDG